MPGGDGYGSYSRSTAGAKPQWPLYLLVLLPIVVVYALTYSKVLSFERDQFFAYILGTLCLAITLVNLQAGLVMVVLSVAISPEFDVSKVNNLRFEDLMIPSVFGIWCLKHIMGRQKLVPSGLKAPILLYLLLAALSTLMNVGFAGLNGSKAFFIYLKYIEYLLVLTMVANLVRTERQVAALILAVLVASLVSAFYGMYQRAAGLDWYGSRVTGPEGETANIYGGYLIFHLLLGFGLFVTCPKPPVKTALFIYMLLMFYVVLRTLSRGSYVGLVAAMVLMGLLRDRRILIWVLLFLCVAPIVFPHDVANRLGTIVHVLPGTGSAAPTSWQSKVASWKQLRGEVFLHPLLGRGVGVFDCGWVDSEYMKVLVESGLLGLAVWSWWILKMLWIGWRGHRRSRIWWQQGFSVGYVCAMVGLLVHAVAATSLTAIRTMESVMIGTGLMVALYNLQEGKGQFRRGWGRRRSPPDGPVEPLERLVRLKRNASFPA